MMEDVLKILQAVLTNIGVVEAKVDHLLRINGGSELLTFSPLKNHSQFLDLEEKLKSDNILKSEIKNIIGKRHPKDCVKLSSLMSEDLLIQFNLRGIQGKEKLLGTCLYEHIFVELLQEKGYSPGDIESNARQELETVKNRLKKRRQYKKNKNKRTELHLHQESFNSSTNNFNLSFVSIEDNDCLSDSPILQKEKATHSSKVVEANIVNRTTVPPDEIDLPSTSLLSQCPDAAMVPVHSAPVRVKIGRPVTVARDVVGGKKFTSISVSGQSSHANVVQSPKPKAIHSSKVVEAKTVNRTTVPPDEIDLPSTSLLSQCPDAAMVPVHSAPIRVKIGRPVTVARDVVGGKKFTSISVSGQSSHANVVQSPKPKAIHSSKVVEAKAVNRTTVPPDEIDLPSTSLLSQCPDAAMVPVHSAPVRVNIGRPVTVARDVVGGKKFTSISVSGQSSHANVVQSPKPKAIHSSKVVEAKAVNRTTVPPDEIDLPSTSLLSQCPDAAMVPVHSAPVRVNIGRPVTVAHYVIGGKKFTSTFVSTQDESNDTGVKEVIQKIQSKPNILMRKVQPKPAETAEYMFKPKLGDASYIKENKNPNKRPSSGLNQNKKRLKMDGESGGF